MKLNQLVHRGLKNILYHTPPRYRGGKISNLFGLQVFRLFYFEVKKRIRKLFYGRGSNIARAIERDGFFVIENFFSAAEFAILKSEIQAFSEKCITEYTERPLTLRFNLYELATNGFHYHSKVLNREFLRRSGLYELVQEILGKRVNVPPRIFYLRQSYQKGHIGMPMIDWQDMPHVDVPYSTLKGVIYLRDTDESNGAFCYAKESNRFSLNRLRAEYSHSIQYYSKSRSRPNPLFGLSTELFSKHPLQPIIGKENTLILFDARGVHRRGDFKDTEPRETIFIEFRETEALINTAVKLKRLSKTLARFSI